MVKKADIKHGDKVLINGGSGGLGSILVQVVKAAVGDSGRVVQVFPVPQNSVSAVGFCPRFLSLLSAASEDWT